MLSRGQWRPVGQVRFIDDCAMAIHLHASTGEYSIKTEPGNRLIPFSAQGTAHGTPCAHAHGTRRNDKIALSVFLRLNNLNAVSDSYVYSILCTRTTRSSGCIVSKCRRYKVSSVRRVRFGIIDRSTHNSQRSIQTKTIFGLCVPGTRIPVKHC